VGRADESNQNEIESLETDEVAKPESGLRPQLSVQKEPPLGLRVEEPLLEQPEENDALHGDALAPPASDLEPPGAEKENLFGPPKDQARDFRGEALEIDSKLDPLQAFPEQQSRTCDYASLSRLEKRKKMEAREPEALREGV
jgi:hypothetical protein